MVGRRRTNLTLALALLAAGAPADVGPYGSSHAALLHRARSERRIEVLPQTEDRAQQSTELSARFLSHVQWLSDPARQGRAPGTQGIDEAADYIEDALLGAGLQPAFAGVGLDPDLPEAHASAYRQPLPVGVQVESLEAHVSFALPDGRIITPTHVEVSPYSSTGMFAGPCTFAGYAIVTGSGGYLGFSGTENFQGRAIIMLSHEPMDERGRSLWSDRGWSFAAPLHRKLNAVARRGAGAVFVVSPPDLDEQSGLTPETAFEDMPPFDFPVVWLAGDAAETILRAGDPEHRGLEALYRLANRQGVVVDLPGVASAVQTSVKRRTLISENVGAVLPGRGELADEFVVIGAHYDHVGKDRDGLIFPGADDNASGTAGLLIAAELLARRYDALPEDQPARSILFLAFTAEELNLRGSAYYVKHPIAPMSQHVLMLNMDMIGRLSFHGLEVGGGESGERLPSLLARHIGASGLHARPMESIGLNRSDHASFLGRKVPSVHFFTGLHGEYHSPNDTPDLVDAKGGAAIAELVADIAFDAATTPEPPGWTGRTGSEPRDETRLNRPKIRTGIVPGAGADGRGMLVARVVEHSSAFQAGLRAGDRITRWNGNPVNGPEDWIPLLLEAEPGDTITVEFRRGGQSQTVALTLQGSGDASPDGGSGDSGDDD